ncbi:hypothetical protein [Fructobacillus evanidus]
MKRTTPKFEPMNFGAASQENLLDGFFVCPSLLLKWWQLILKSASISSN